jgi:hypothetical protein
LIICFNWIRNGHGAIRGIINFGNGKGHKQRDGDFCFFYTGRLFWE